MKYLLSLSLFVLLFSVNASAQIVTSKKEAMKKGIYSYVEKNNSETVAFSGRKSPSMGGGVASAAQPSILANKPVAEAKEKIKDGSGKAEGPAGKTSVINDAPDADFTPAPSESYLAEQIVNNALDFVGVRYRGGGTSREGMDCSGMVFATFKIFDITLPRSSQAMSETGMSVKLSEVKKGDLLFFRNSHNRRAINHVGIVADVTPEGEVLFVHSSTSSGVVVSSMNEAYHSRTFVEAKRVIEE